MSNVYVFIDPLDGLYLQAAESADLATLRAWAVQPSLQYYGTLQDLERATLKHGHQDFTVYHLRDDAPELPSWVVARRELSHKALEARIAQSVARQASTAAHGKFKSIVFYGSEEEVL